MASFRKEYKQDANLRVLQIINENPHVTLQVLDHKVGIFNGSTYNLLISPIDNGFIEFSNLYRNSQKVNFFGSESY